MVIFLDESGNNALPPLVLVTIYPAGVPQTSGNIVAQGYLNVGGVLNATLLGAVEYTAVFQGSQAPANPVTFQANAKPGQPTTVIVPGYMSPSLSQVGYAVAQTQLWVNKLFGDTAKNPGGNAYALAWGMAAALAYLDLWTQNAMASTRLLTCSGSQIDTWAYDFFGNAFLRFPDESDSIFVSRILTFLGPKGTLSAVQTIIQQYYVATALQRQLEAETNISYDTTGGYDTRGGYDVYVPPQPIQELIPVVTVWDRMTNPTTAATYGVSEPQFVINIGFTGPSLVWYLDHSFLDFDTILAGANTNTPSTSAPDPNVAALVNLSKAVGTQPLYQYSLTG
jgi:hypothetical protein